MLLTAIQNYKIGQWTYIFEDMGMKFISKHAILPSGSISPARKLNKYEGGKNVHTEMFPRVQLTKIQHWLK